MPWREGCVGISWNYASVRDEGACKHSGCSSVFPFVGLPFRSSQYLTFSLDPTGHRCPSSTLKLQSPVSLNPTHLLNCNSQLFISPCRSQINASLISSQLEPWYRGWWLGSRMSMISNEIWLASPCLVRPLRFYDDVLWVQTISNIVAQKCKDSSDRKGS